MACSETQSCSSAAPSPSVAKPLTVVQWWIVFGLDTIVVSLAFQAFREFTLLPNTATGLSLAATVLMVLVLSGMLGYDSYAAAKLKQQVVNHVSLFEWLFKKQYRLKTDAVLKSSISGECYE